MEIATDVPQLSNYDLPLLCVGAPMEAGIADPVWSLEEIIALLPE
jgi:hypothetical protein